MLPRSCISLDYIHQITCGKDRFSEKKEKRKKKNPHRWLNMQSDCFLKYGGIGQKRQHREGSSRKIRQALEHCAGSWKDYKGDDSKTRIEAQR